MEIEYSHRNIYSILKRRSFERNRLFEVQIDVTHRCNAHCSFCFQGKTHSSKGVELSINEYRRLFKELKEMGVFFLAFSGGEPFLRDDIVDIINEAKKLGFLITMVSNLQVATQSQLEDLVNVGISRLTVSFHSLNAANYCKMFGVSKKYYNNALHNVEYLRANNVPLGIAVTVTNENVHELSQIVDGFVAMGFEKSSIGLNMLVKGKNEIAMRPSADMVKKNIHIEEEIVDNILMPLETSFICTAGHIFCSIDPYGAVKACPFLDIGYGNIRDNSIKDIWINSISARIVRDINQEKSFEKCLKCSNNRTCHVCMATNLNESGHYNLPTDDYCSFRTQLSKSLGVIM